MSRITLKDIAEKVGVSRMSVSDALRGTGRINVDTRKKILSVADELGYRPNAHALSMRKGKNSFIGLLLSKNPGKSHLFDPLIKGILNTAEENNFQLIVRELADKELEDEESMKKFVQSWLADGMLVYYTHGFPKKFKEIVNKYKITSLWINSRDDYNSVYIDGYQAAYEATRKFITDGLKKIVYFDLNKVDGVESHYSRTERYRGYCSAMQASSLEPVCVSRKKEEKFQFYDVCYQWFMKNGLPEAIIGRTPEDITAAVCAAEAVLPDCIPSETQAIGFSTTRLVLTGREITSLLVPMYDMGKQATEMLIQRINNKKNDLPSKGLLCSRCDGYTTIKK